MHYINNVTLSILIALLRDGELVISAHDRESLDELAIYISSLDGLFMDRPDNMSIEEEEEFNENYAPTITYRKHNIELYIQCEDHERLEQFLQEYVNNYNDGVLVEDGRSNEFDTISALHDMLIAETDNVTTNKTRYIEMNVKYAPLILLKYFDNNNFIQELTIQLAPKEEMPYPMRLFDEENPDELSYRQNWQEYFSCRYVLDMNWYIEEYERSISKTVTKDRRTEFSPVQQKVYNYLLKSAKNGIFISSRTDLKNCMLLTTKDKTLTELRAQYREIFRKAPDFNIIWYDRASMVYRINQEILTDKLSN